jgi:hypothetical protein
VQPLLQWKGTNYYTFGVCICSLRYSACNVHASYIHPWPVRLYKPLQIKRHGFRKFFNVRYVFWCAIQLLSETFHILGRNEPDVIKIYIYVQVNYPLFLWDFNENLTLSTEFWRTFKCQISSQSVQWEPSCTRRMDWQTKMTKLIVAFRMLRSRPKYVVIQ